jgi:hypothetical protein
MMWGREIKSSGVPAGTQCGWWHVVRWLSPPANFLSLSGAEGEFAFPRSFPTEAWNDGAGLAGWLKNQNFLDGTFGVVK